MEEEEKVKMYMIEKEEEEEEKGYSGSNYERIFVFRNHKDGDNKHNRNDCVTHIED